MNTILAKALRRFNDLLIRKNPRLTSLIDSVDDQIRVARHIKSALPKHGDQGDGLSTERTEYREAVEQLLDDELALIAAWKSYADSLVDIMKNYAAEAGFKSEKDNHDQNDDKTAVSSLSPTMNTIKDLKWVQHFVNKDLILIGVSFWAPASTGNAMDSLQGIKTTYQNSAHGQEDVDKLFADLKLVKNRTKDTIRETLSTTGSMALKLNAKFQELKAQGKE